MVEFQGILPETIPSTWDSFRPFVKMATDHSQGELTPEYVLRRIMDSDMQLLALIEDEQTVGAAVTEVLKLQSGETTLKVVCLGGKNFDEWGSRFVGIMKNWAKDLGAARVQMTGREGWQKKLKKLDWKVTSINMEVEVNE